MITVACSWRWVVIAFWFYSFYDITQGSMSNPADDRLTLDENLSFNRDKRPNISLSVTGTSSGGNWSFSEAICQGDNHPSRNTSNGHNLPMELCTPEAMVNMVSLSYRSTRYTELMACQYALKLYPQSRLAGDCALWITYEQVILQVSISALRQGFPDNRYQYTPNSEPPKYSIWGNSNDFETMMRIGQSLVESCQLRQPINANWNLEDMAFKYFAKVCLMISQYLLSSSPQSSFANLCWEPELQEAHRLYEAPGKWNVDEKCVSTLQTIAVKVLTFFLTNTLSRPFGILRNRLDSFLHRLLLLSEVPNVSKHIFLFLMEYSDFLLQAYWYPPFNRFALHAQTRNIDNSSIVSVSCKGLQGSRNEVYNTTLQLLRLVIVNELRYQKYQFATTYWCSAFNHVMPWLLPFAL